MANTSLLGSYGGQAGDALMFRNRIINGNFDIWQRGTSQTSAGYGSDDRWINAHQGSTKTHSQQAFTVGQTDVLGNPEFFSRTVVSSVAGAGNHTLKSQRIEDVRTLAGQTATLSFWAKADAPKNIAISFSQLFGTGGSPSAAVVGIGVNTIALTTSWKYYTVTVSIPSIAGKTIGTAKDSYLQLNFWFEAGSDYNVHTNSLGQQSGTFDLAQIQLESGAVATPFERRPIGVETQLAMRYYEKGQSYTGNRSPDNIGLAYLCFKVTKRATPNITANQITGTGYVGLDSAGIYFQLAGAGTTYAPSWTAEAEL